MTPIETPRVAVNGRFLNRPSTGVERFAHELLQAWLSLNGKRDVRIFVPPSNNGSFASSALHSLTQSVGFTTGHLWEQCELPLYARDRMLLNFCNTAPIFRTNQLAVLHDASVMVNPSHYSWLFRTWYRVLYNRLFSGSCIVATVSNFSASELMRFFGRHGKRIEVIYESGEHILRSEPDAAILDRLGIRRERYVLGVGSQTSNKNFGALLGAAELIGAGNVKVVAAGGSNARVFSGNATQPDNLILAGYVSNSELRALYENAECFVFPSFYEGFGLPPLEAMHCGCPVLVSRRAAIPEICGDAAAYCEPDDHRDIARQLKRILGSRTLRDEMRESGYARTRSFTWRKSAERLDDIMGWQTR